MLVERLIHLASSLEQLGATTEANKLQQLITIVARKILHQKTQKHHKHHRGCKHKHQKMMKMLSYNGPIKKAEIKTEHVMLELWRGVNDPNTIKEVNGKLLLGSNLANKEVWFAEGWTSNGRDVAILHAGYALVKIKVPFSIDVEIENGKRKLILESLKPTVPGWKSVVHSNSLGRGKAVSYVHDGPIEIKPENIEVK